MERASATAAYEHELEAIPNSVAKVSCFGESPPRAFAIAWWDTTAWTIPESVKPRMRGQRISQNMLKAVNKASRIAIRMVMIVFLPSLFALVWMLYRPYPLGRGYIKNITPHEVNVKGRKQEFMI